MNTETNTKTTMWKIIALDWGYLITNPDFIYPEYAGDTLKEALAFVNLKNSTL